MTKISPAQLASYVADQISAGISKDSLARQLAGYLIDQRQTRELPAVMRAIDAEMTLRGSDQIVITTTYATSVEVKEQIAEILNAKYPVFSEVIDPSIIGGVKARRGESEIDLTVRNKLNRFKTEIMRSK